MLKEMRDAAGDSGEFYKPRALVRFMVAITDPRLGETVLDPASGTGGFLVEAFNISAIRSKTSLAAVFYKRKALWAVNRSRCPTCYAR
jgi:type I restriction enzyme M protein